MPYSGTWYIFAISGLCMPKLWYLTLLAVHAFLWYIHPLLAVQANSGLFTPAGNTCLTLVYSPLLVVHVLL